jgi:hypothetical protein
MRVLALKLAAAREQEQARISSAGDPARAGAALTGITGASIGGPRERARTGSGSFAAGAAASPGAAAARSAAGVGAGAPQPAPAEDARPGSAASTATIDLLRGNDGGDGGPTQAAAAAARAALAAATSAALAVRAPMSLSEIARSGATQLQLGTAKHRTAIGRKIQALVMSHEPLIAVNAFKFEMAHKPGTRCVRALLAQVQFNSRPPARCVPRAHRVVPVARTRDAGWGNRPSHAAYCGAGRARQVALHGLRLRGVPQRHRGARRARVRG